MCAKRGDVLPRANRRVLTLFTDEVLGNAKLAGFSLSVSAIIGLVMMTGAHFLLAAIA